MPFHSESLITELIDKAQLLRTEVVTMIHRVGSGHPGGSLSAADIVTALFFHRLRLDPARPDWPERDRFILSKGHAAPLLYAALAHRGFFPVEELTTLRRLGSRLQGHPDRLRTPGVEMTAGALGHGLAIGAGLALAARGLGYPARRVPLYELRFRGRDWVAVALATLLLAGLLLVRYGLGLGGRPW